MTPRPSRKGDENALKALWREVFGDTAGAMAGRWCSPLREASRRISARRARHFGAGTRSRCAPERYPTAQACRFRPFAGRSRRRNSAHAARCGLTVSPTQSTATGFSSSSPLPGSFSAASTATFTPWTTDACVKRSPRARATSRFSWGSTARSRSTGA